MFSARLPLSKYMHCPVCHAPQPLYYVCLSPRQQQKHKPSQRRASRSRSKQRYLIDQSLPPPSYLAIPLTPISSNLNNLHITSRHALRNPSLLHLRPPIPGILLNQHKPLPLRHAMLGVALRAIIIQRLDVPQLLCATPWGHGGALLFPARSAGGGGGGAAVRGER